MPVYATDYGDFTTKMVDGFEIYDDADENLKSDGIYCVIGSIDDENLQVHKFGVVFKNEYLSKEYFFNKIKKLKLIRRLF